MSGLANLLGCEFKDVGARDQQHLWVRFADALMDHHQEEGTKKNKDSTSIKTRLIVS